MKKIAYLMCLLLGFFIAGCADDAGSSSADTDTSSADYSVGSTVKYGTASYYVVSNSFNSGVNKSALAARSAENGSNDDVLEMVKTVSVEKMKSYAEEYFGPNILLIRTAGKVTVPNGKTKDYISAYNAVTKNLPDGEKIADYFNEIEAAAKNTVSYEDVYLVLNESGEKVGLSNIVWAPEVNSAFKDGDETKTLFELLQDFSPEVIRNTVPGQYKIRTYDKTLKCDYEVLDYKLQENGHNRLLTNAPDSLYSVKNEKVIRAATLMNEWNSDDNSWRSGYIALSAMYGSSTVTAGVYLRFFKISSDKYGYYIQGTKLAEGTVYCSKRTVFSFDENGKYTAENFILPEDANVYSTDADMKYTKEARTIPIEFILNDDGSVSFGDSVYKWIENWRDYIVSTHPDEAKAYEE